MVWFKHKSGLSNANCFYQIQMYSIQRQMFGSNKNASTNAEQETTLHLNANANATFSNAFAFEREPGHGYVIWRVAHTQFGHN